MAPQIPCVPGGNKKRKLPRSKSLTALLSRASGLPDWTNDRHHFPCGHVRARPGSAPRAERASSSCSGNRHHDDFLESHRARKGVSPTPWSSTASLQMYSCCRQSPSSGFLLFYTSCSLESPFASMISPSTLPTGSGTHHLACRCQCSC